MHSPTPEAINTLPKKACYQIRQARYLKRVVSLIEVYSVNHCDCSMR